MLCEFLPPELLRHLEASAFVKPLCSRIVLDHFQCHATAPKFASPVIDGREKKSADALPATVTMHSQVMNIEQWSGGER